MPDHEDSAAAIAHRSLEPLLASLHDALTEEGATHLAHDLFLITAEIYAVGHRDGVRCAVADIAPEAARHGLHLWLGAEERCERERDGAAAIMEDIGLTDRAPGGVVDA